jgi:hypothetical protein
MVRCFLGTRKLRKIAAIVGPRYEVHLATVRGGSPHFLAEVCLLDRQTGARPVARVNYKSGEWELKSGPLSTWTHTADIVI